MTMRRDPLAYLTTELDALKQQGLYRHLRILDGEQKAHTTVRPPSGRQSLVEQLPRPDDASAAARARRSRRSRGSASASGSVRTIAGTMDIHMELERRLAEFKKTEAVVVFQSGFAANAGTVAADPRPRTTSSSPTS